MPIKVQSNLPAIKVLESENIFVMPNEIAIKQAELQEKNVAAGFLPKLSASGGYLYANKDFSMELAPFLGGIEVVIGRPLFVHLDDPLRGLLVAEIVQPADPLHPLFHLRVDEHAHQMGVFAQRVVRAAPHDDAGPIGRQLLDGVELGQENLVVDGHGERPAPARRTSC